MRHVCEELVWRLHEGPGVGLLQGGNQNDVPGACDGVTQEVVPAIDLIEVLVQIGQEDIDPDRPGASLCDRIDEGSQVRPRKRGDPGGGVVIECEFVEEHHDDLTLAFSQPLLE